MKNIIFRELQRADMQKIGNVLRTRDELNEEGVERRKIIMEWCAFHNPFAQNETTYFVAEDQGEIVGYLGRMPTMFIIKGEVQKGYYMHDLYVHPEYRRKGLGIFMAMGLYKMAEEQSPSFVLGIWTNKINLNIIKRRGYKFIRPRHYVKVLEPYPLVKKYIKKKYPAKALNPILKAFLLISDYFIERRFFPCRDITHYLKATRLGLDYDDFYQKIIPKLKISPLKNSHYLNWKYLDKPFPQAEILLVKTGRETNGLAIVFTKKENGILIGQIVDIIADPEAKKAIASLIQASISYFKKKKVSYIHCIFSDKRYASVLKRFLFFKRATGTPLCLFNLDKSRDKDYLLDIDNWHIVPGDSDGKMF